MDGTEFPSPVGELHFSISSSFVVVEVDSCFRPLSGNYISQLKAKYDLIKMAGWFPSPVGELHFSIVGLQLMKTVKDVSVPCRGTTFLNLLVNLNKIRRITRFRPLSGNYISQS